MDNKQYTIDMNKNKKEILTCGTPLFPCSFYHRDVHEYITDDIPYHWHPELEIFILEEGHVHVSFFDCEFDVLPGDGYVINANVLHGIVCLCEEPCRYRSIVFDPSIISGIPGSAFDIFYVRPFLEQGGVVWHLRSDSSFDTASIVHYFYIAQQAYEQQTIGYEFMIRDALSHIILSLNDVTQEHKQVIDPLQEQRMKQMLRWLDEHYAEPITVAQTAAVAHICVRECQRYFSNTLHISPIQYVIRRRVSAAAELLLSKNHSIIEIGIQCGFENPSYFTKQFKKVTGMTPRDYRNKNR